MKTCVKMNCVRACQASFVLFLLLFSLFGVQQPVYAAISAGYSEYYIPGSTDQLFQILKDIDNDPDLGNALGGGGTCTAAPCNRMHNVTTISVSADNATIYYDHWENGYGTGSLGNDETYVANKGNVLTFESSNILVPRAAGNTCTSTNPNGASTACYDGRDRIYVAGAAVSVAQSFWPEVTGTVFANAWEVYPIKPYQTDYTIPVGEDLSIAPFNYTDFDQVFVIVQGTQNGTTVEINNPATAGLDVSLTLGRGEVTQLFHIGAGTTVHASAPVQVQFITGDFFAGIASDSRSYTAVPSGLWEASYYSPVSGFAGGNDTDVFIYNPTASDLNINYQDRLGSGSLIVPANSTRSYQSLTGHFVPTNSALYLEAADGVTEFWAVGSVDTENADYNYGFTMIPPTLLTDEYFVGWAPGTTNLSANGSPVYVTPIADDTTIFVDFSPADGVVDATYTLDRIERQKIFDPDRDNTGMHIWATGPIAVVWGEDPETAQVGNPFIDAGYAILPLNQQWLDTVITIDKTANPSVVGAGAGQISVFTLVIESDQFGIDNVSVLDNLPQFWAYVPGTTTITLPNGSTLTGANADPAVNGLDLTWDQFPVNPLNMGPNETLTIAYQAQTTGTPPLGISTNLATVTGTKGTETFSASDTATINHIPGGLTKTVNPPQATIGEIVNYTVVVSIPPGIYAGASLVDTMDRGLAFVGCDAITASGVTTNVLGDFAAICLSPTTDDAGGGSLEDIDRRVTYNFGTLTNVGVQDGTVTLAYRAIVLDIAANLDGVTRNNGALWTWANGTGGPARAAVEILEPKLVVDKSADINFIANGSEVTITLAVSHANNSHLDAYDVILTDPLPTGLDYVANSLDCSVGAQDPDLECAFDNSNPAQPLIRARWSAFTRTGGTGLVRFRVVGNASLPANGNVTNVANLAWTSLPGDHSVPQSFSGQFNQPNPFAVERFFDPGSAVDLYGTSDALALAPLGGGDPPDPGAGNDDGEDDDPDDRRRTSFAIGGFLIPVTGFAPGAFTDLGGASPAYDATGFSIEIPALKTIIPIAGVPLRNGTWDVSGLWNQAGYLQGTAFPTFAGNSVITAHVVNPDGTPGPFARIKQLGAGDYIFINLGGYRYTYEVSSNSRVMPDDIRILRHEEKPWITLVTCDKYDVKTGEYLRRVVVRAVLIDIDFK